MKRYVVFLLAIITALLTFMTGCQGGRKSYTGKILPSRIENIQDKDRIPEGAEGIEKQEYDVTAFNHRMFVGTWYLQDVQGTAADLAVPAPSGSGADTWSLRAFPLDIVFGSPQRFEDREIYRIRFDDVTYMEATYELADQGAESGSSDSGIAAAQTPEGMCFRMMYDVVDTTIGVGFTGEVTDELYYNEVVDSVDVFEVDYDFSWSGYELTLKYGGASATYVPATFKGDMQSAVKGFSAGNGQTKISGWNFSPLDMNGDGSGMISTYYDTNIPMKYEFSEDGKFTVVTEHGEEYSYDRYWYSDSCLTLAAGDMKMMYQHNYLVLFGNDTYRSKKVEHMAFVNELTIAGKKMGSPLWKSVKELIDGGYHTNVDVNLSRIPSGSITPEFELIFRTAHLKVRAINPTDLELPLGGCIICWYQCDEDSGSVKRRVVELTSDDSVVCGETTREELQEFVNLYSIDDNTMIIPLGGGGRLYDYDFSDYSARLLDGMDGENATELLVFEMEGDTLHVVTEYIADLITGNLENNAEYGKLPDLSAAAMRENARRRDEIAENVKKVFSSQSGVSCDNYGTVYIPWSEIFQYGKAELSDAGKERIDEVIETYKGALQEYDNISTIEVGVHARIDLIEGGQSFTVPRAKALEEYLNSETSGSQRKSGDLDGTGITYAGYGSAAFLKGENFGNTISVRFLIIPESYPDSNNDISLVLKAPEREEIYDYMKLREEDVGRKLAAFAQKYAGEIIDEHYVNQAVGMDWTLPEGWHFFSDDEMISLNGGSAKELLQNDQPVYAFAAVNDSYERMIDLRLYAYKGELYEEAVSEFAESLYNSYKSYCETTYSDVDSEAEDVTIGNRTVKKGTFRFSTDGQTFVRKQYYLVLEGASAVITLSGTEDSEFLDDPGITESAGGSGRIKIIDKESLGLDEEETVEYGVPRHIDIY